jgi:hypothetical protein
VIRVRVGSESPITFHQRDHEYSGLPLGMVERLADRFSPACQDLGTHCL